MNEVQPQDRPEVSLPFSKVIQLEARDQWAVINDSIGMCFWSDRPRQISFLCDNRVHIEKVGKKKPRSNNQLAKISSMHTNFPRGVMIHLIKGNELLIVENVASGTRLPGIKVYHSGSIEVKITNLDYHQLKQKLSEGLRT